MAPAVMVAATPSRVAVAGGRKLGRNKAHLGARSAVRVTRCTSTRAPLQVRAGEGNGGNGDSGEGLAYSLSTATGMNLSKGQFTFPSSSLYPGNVSLPNGTDDSTSSRMRLFSGSSNPGLSEEVSRYMGVPLSPVTIKRFADGEIYVQINESIRGCDVFIIQPTCPPANDNLMELLVMIDAARRASARSITAVIPYFGYARADRKASGRESIAAKLTSNLITEAGADRVLVIDLHSGQGVGYFDIPVDLIHASSVALDYLAHKNLPMDDYVVVSPDVGGVARARAFAKKLQDAPLAIIDKRRTGHNVAEVMNLIGDVEGKNCIMVDDMIDTAGTLMGGAKLLRKMGAKSVTACATHAVFSPPANERLSNEELFNEVIVTNTMPITRENGKMFDNITVLSVANLLAETIWRVHSDSSIQRIQERDDQ